MTKQASNANVVITLTSIAGGTETFNDRDEDTYFTSVYDQDEVAKFKSADGPVAYALLPSLNGQITLNCSQTSDLNNYLNRIRRATRINPKAIGFNITMEETDTGTRIGGQCVIFKHADIERGSSLKPATWVLDLPEMRTTWEKSNDIGSV